MPTKRAIKSDRIRSTRCYLLDLPAELRLHIIELALGTDNVQVSLIYDAKDANVLRQPHISQTCQLLRIESLPVFYGQRVFSWLDLDDSVQLEHLKSWLTASSKHTHFIQDIEMVFCDIHLTKLKIEVRPRSEVYFDVRAMQNKYLRGWRRVQAAPKERCPTLKLFDKVEAELRDLFSSAGRNGLNANDYIGAANLLFTGHSYTDCT